MNKSELSQKLRDKNVPKWWYHLDVIEYNDNFSLRQTETLWEVFFGERGIKYDLKTFDTEEDACEYLYGQLMEDMK